MKNRLNRIFLLNANLLLIVMSCWSCSPKVATIVLVPDTQYYAEKYPHILHSQIDWIVENKENIDFVLQQGDLTQNNSREEWEIAQSAFYKLNDQLPYVLAVGNHDMGSTPGKFADTRNTTLFNTYFPYDLMAQLPGFGGVYEPGKMDNAYYLLEAGNHKWMILTLEFGPRNIVLDWANEIVKQYPVLKEETTKPWQIPFNDSIRISISSDRRGEICYTIESNGLKTDQAEYEEPFVLKETALVKAGLYVDDTLTGKQWVQHFKNIDEKL